MCLKEQFNFSGVFVRGTAATLCNIITVMRQLSYLTTNVFLIHQFAISIYIMMNIRH